MEEFVFVDIPGLSEAKYFIVSVNYLRVIFKDLSMT